MWLYDRWGTSLHVCREGFQLLALASWEIDARFITQIRQWSVLRSRDHISMPPSFQKLMSGSADSRSLALYFTHVHLRAIRPSGEMLAGAHFMHTEGSRFLESPSSPPTARCLCELRPVHPRASASSSTISLPHDGPTQPPTCTSSGGGLTPDSPKSA